MKKSLLAIGLSLASFISLNAQEIWDDFDNPSKVNYIYWTGELTRGYDNPNTTGINPSAKIAHYWRNDQQLYDIIVIDPAGTTVVADVSGFLNGSKKMSMKLYTNAPVGTPVQIILENKAKAAGEYPAGRHSVYTAITKVQDNWEEIEFIFNSQEGQPDASVLNTEIDRMVILFNPGVAAEHLYQFDDLKGPDFFDPCGNITKDFSIIDNFECQRNLNYLFFNGTFYPEDNPLTNGINTSEKCGYFKKYGPPANDGAFGGDLMEPFTTDQYNTAKIQLYSTAPSQNFYVILQDAGNTTLLERILVTESTTAWQEYTVDLKAIPVSASIAKVVLLLNPGTPTEDFIYLDNFTLGNSSCTTPAPTGNSVQNFCNSATINDIIANGSIIKWYDASTDGNLLSIETPLVNGQTYYASQTVNGCESQSRLAVTAIIINTSEPTGFSTQEFCNSAIINDIIVNGTNIKWYDAANGGNLLTLGTSLVNGMIYYASQTVNGCESQNRLAVTTIFKTSAPTGSTEQVFCNSATINDLIVNGSIIKWYDASTDGNLLSTETPLVNGQTYYASQTIDGCESQNRLAVIVNFNISSPSGLNVQIFCNSANIIDLVVTGSNIKWYDAAEGGNLLNTGSSLINGQIYYASQTVNGCESQSRFAVTAIIIITTPPSGLSNQEFCNSAIINDIIVNGFSIQWYDAATGGNLINTGTSLVNGQIYYASQTVNGCESSTRFSVQVAIIPKPENSVTLSGGTLTANHSGGSYQWLDCDNNLNPISGANLISFTPLLTGNYAVQITQDGCVANSDCYLLAVSSVGNRYTERIYNTINKLYPNPNNGTFNFETSEVGNFLVINSLGQKIFEFEVSNANNEIIVPNASKGVYYLINSEFNIKPIKLIIY
jgi:hypothetical protein